MLLTRRLPLWWILGTAFFVCFFSLTGPGFGKALVDLNTASSQELDSLKGIGPATAKKIIENRPYTSVNDLTKAGLSAKEIETLKPLVTVTAAKTTGPAATAPEKSAKPVESSKDRKSVV
jgi:predicted DNA-binding helix-hairpin-helix protein